MVRESEPTRSGRSGALGATDVPGMLFCRLTDPARLSGSWAVREQWRVLIDEIKEKNQVIEQATSQQERIRLAGEKTREIRRIFKGPVVNGISTEFRPYAWPLLCGVEKGSSPSLPTRWSVPLLFPFQSSMAA